MKTILAPGSYLLITTLQNNLVSPVIYGQPLKLNPIAILVSVAIWGFIWGITVAFLAVPILAGAKVICDHTDQLQAIWAFLE